MGVDMFIWSDDDKVQEQVVISNFLMWNEFLNWVAQNTSEKDFPNILDHSPAEGKYTLEEGVEPDLMTGSVPDLRKEAEELLKMKPPDYVLIILRRILQACEIALQNELEITMF